MMLEIGDYKEAKIMPAATTLEIRRNIIREVESGCTIREAAQNQRVSSSTAYRMMRLHEKTGSVEPQQCGGHRRPLLEPYAAGVEQIVKSDANITLAAIQSKIKETYDVDVAVSTIHAMLVRMGLRGS